MAHIAFTDHAYGHGLLSFAAPATRRVLHKLQGWAQRHRERADLARFLDQSGTYIDRDLHDLGLTRSQLAFEAAKPFWRV
jgi:uncharacterized protein YjiS (DUF1127 family)